MSLLSWFIPSNEKRLRDACSGDTSAVKKLLAAGADPNASAKDGMTPLMIAAGCEQLEIVRLLIRAGANVNAQSSERFTALQLAYAQAHGHYLKSLSSTEFPESRTRTDVFKVLLDAGADPNAPDDGMTVLMTAAKHNDPDVVDLLLSHGADVNRVNISSGGEMTALTYAAAFGNGEIIPKLIAAGADVDFQPETGNRITALMHAAMAGRSQHVPVVRALLAARANKALTTRDGDTALDLARENVERYPKPTKESQQIVSLLG